MHFVTWTVRLLIFLFLLAFAVKNTDRVTLRFYFELAWQTPLIVLLLAFFAAGAAVGLAAALATLFRQRREIAQLRRESLERRRESLERAVPPQDALPPPGIDA